ncbi:phytase [Alteromonas sp. 14N.309.X.WAT.G.H12]|uniref:phytase n=1 Tax=Alteromonas sp. 14N.309.X.WAT.G.H12 TaxID=3120824 RepID=UPI002FD34E81
MKTLPATLPLVLASLVLASCASHTASPPAQPLAVTPFSIPGQQLTPFTVDSSLHYLVTSETNGLTVTDENQSVIAKQPGHFSQSDIVMTADNKRIIGALNNDTYAVNLFTYDTQRHTFTALATLPAANADIEAVCLSAQDKLLVITTIDTVGRMTQHGLAQNTLFDIRQVNVGTGVKSCQQDSQTQTLYLADEYTGLWQYDSQFEAGDGHDLLTLPTQSGIEGVGVDNTGAVVTVSPADNALYVYNKEKLNAYPLTGDYQLESVRITSHHSDIIAGVYDDKSASLYTVSLPAQPSQIPAKTVAVDGSLTAFAQTDPVARFGDAADDPAIWYVDDAPETSVILGTDKKSGLDLYDLSGQRLQHLAVGRLNNVDVRRHWQTDNGVLAIAAATNRTTKTIDIFVLDPMTRKANLTSRLPSSLNDLYGLCLYQHNNTLDVLANDTDGHVERHRLSFVNDTIKATIVDTFTVPSQPEGCVADDENGVLYYGEEAVGVWKRNLEVPASSPKLIARVGGKVKADIEGMALFDVDGKRYLVVSSQGNDRYAVYTTTEDHTLLGTFNVVPDFATGIDGTSETDGLEAISFPLGKTLPDGLLVVQDGHNVMPSQQQNFKLISGSQLAEFIRKYR